jgi:hypothetical protein
MRHALVQNRGYIGLGILLLFDVPAGTNLHTHGWPAKLTLTEKSRGVEVVKVSPLPFTATDFWMVAALVGAHTK